MPAASNCKKKQGEPWKSKKFSGLSATHTSFLSPSLMPKAVDAKPSTIRGESMPASLLSRVEKGMHKKLTAPLTIFAGECVRKNSEIFNQKSESLYFRQKIPNFSRASKAHVITPYGELDLSSFRK